MIENEGNGVQWPQLLLLACVFVLGITVPLTWHRRNARYLTEPLHGQSKLRDAFGALALNDPPLVVAETSVEGLEPVAPSQAAVPGSAFAGLVVNDSVKDFSKLDGLQSKPESIHSFRYDFGQLNAPPSFAAQAWPWPEAIHARFEILEGHEDVQQWCTNVKRMLDRLTLLTSIRDQEVPELLDGLQAAADLGWSIAESVDDDEIRYQLNSTSYDISRRVDVWRAAHSLALTSTDVVSEPIVPLAEVVSAGMEPNAHASQTSALNVSRLLASLEQYEYTRLGSDSHNIAGAISHLANSEDPAEVELAEQLDRHYRNANFRVAVNGDLLNRMLPKPKPQSGRVNQHVLGVPVWGNSWTRTRLYTRLIPDRNRIRIGVESWGVVNSKTTAASGPVCVYNKGRTAFLVRKLILVDHNGVSAKHTVADASSDVELLGIDSDYDPVPLLGSFVRNQARKRVDEQRDDAICETERQVAAIALRKFDEQIVPQLKKTIDKFYYEVWAPMERIGLDPTAIELSTTEKRAVSRMRVGNTRQLTAHTARPRAWSNSLISMQVHESALNNALAQFDLDGRTMTLHDLYLHICKKLDQPVKEVPDSMPGNVVVGFVPRDAVRVRCEDGIMKLVIALSKVSKGTKYNWSDITVRANYGIEVDGLQAILVRSGSIELEGKRLRTRDQVALRGVFSKLLSRSNQVQLVPDKITKDTRLSDLEVSQRVIDDGWIGVAIAPSPGSTNQARITDPAVVR